MTCNRYVFIGGPGAGKTTILDALATEGFCSMPDMARAVIRERLDRGLTPRPEPVEFARRILAGDILNFDTAASMQSPVLFDRGVVDALGGLYAAGGITQRDLQETLTRYRYNERVFLFPPWEDIYTTDSERDHTFEHAEAVHTLARSLYQRCGYQPLTVPVGSIADRVAFIKRHLTDQND